MTSLATPSVASSTLGVELGAGVETELGVWVGARVGVGVLLGVGVDVVDTGELAEMIETSGPSFMDLCWTPSEQAYCVGSIPRLAARWAAKEAIMKALGRGIGEVDPIDIEVVSIEGEPPTLQLHGSAEAFALERRMSQLSISLTHEGTCAVAFVVAIGEAVDFQTGTATGVASDTPKAS